MKTIIFATLLQAVLTICHAQDFTQYPSHVCDFFESSLPYAEYLEERFGVPAAVTLAVSAYETGFGRSKNATERSNFFGMKDAYNNDEVWQCYKDKLHSFNHFGIIVTSGRYKYLKNIKKSNLTSWCFGLQLAGFNTSDDYASNLIAIIKKYNLDKI